jgi:AraC family transcriptional regulator
MEKTIELAVARVIEAMRENLGEQLTIDDMARTAMFSKFHFSRVFQRATGVSPGRFLSAMRLHEAKRLLVSTSLTVTDISHRVGYTSVGTFSSRFRNSVGVSPTTYRQLGNHPPRTASDGRRSVPSRRSATVRGDVSSAGTEQLGLIFIGLFADPIPRGQPVRCTILHSPGPFALENVPMGSWYLLAHSLACGFEEAVYQPPLDGVQAPALCVGCHGRPITIRPDTVSAAADLQLRPLPSPDPALLQALLDIRSVALSVGAA